MVTPIDSLPLSDDGGGIRDRLRALLEADVQAGTVPVSARGAINRKRYAERLGCSPSRMSQLTSIFAEFEEKVDLTYIPAEPSLAKELCALLKADVEAGVVPRSRGGRISRTHYAQKLGCTVSAFGRCIAVFAEFERKLEITTGPMRHLPNMRAWLAASYESKELRIRDGKIDRTAFSARFGLRGGAFMVRHPEIRKLLEGYDARVEREGYLPALQSEELERLRKALAENPELNKDRITINKVALAAVANVPQARLRDRPFADAIATVQAEITERAKASEIDPYFHDRVFRFSDLITSWGETFAVRVAVRFKQVLSGTAATSSKQPYLALINALDWIGTSASPHCLTVVAEAKDCGRVSNADEWEDALFAYRDSLKAEVAKGKASESYIDGHIKSLRAALEALMSGGIVPIMATPMPGLKYARRRASHRPSVAEASSSLDRNATDYVAFARDHFESARKTLAVDLGTGDSEPFFTSIGQELSALAVLPDDPAEAVRLVLERRLTALKDRALAIVAEAAQMHERGRYLLSQATLDCAQFDADYRSEILSHHERIVLVHDLFPRRTASDEDVERGVANLLALIEQTRDGIPPRGSGSDPDYGQFFAKRYLQYGGLGTIEPMLIPDANAVGAALTLYLIDSGANVSVGRTLNRDCLEPSDLAGYRRITGHKARAGGKPIIIDLPEDSPTVRAIEWLLSAGRRLPASAEQDQDRLFLMRIGGRVQMMTPHWYTGWFKDFAASTPAVKGLNLVPSMLRPSVLLHAALSNDGRLMTGMALAQHTTRVSQGYQQKYPTRMLYDRNIRRFQIAFESLVMANVHDAASKLGITMEQFEARIGDLRASGLGTFCRNHRGRPGERSGSCSTVDCWNNCPNLLIVADVEAIAALQLWQTSLREVQPEWERDRPERWDEVWLPWRCLTDVVEEKMVRGPMIKIWRAASKRAAEISVQPDYVPPRPW